MRSTLDVRICHLLRVMRTVAPVEWSLGLPFPWNVASGATGRATECAEGISPAAWLEDRAVLRHAA
jgi:hypothetical protein